MFLASLIFLSLQSNAATYVEDGACKVFEITQTPFLSKEEKTNLKDLCMKNQDRLKAQVRMRDSLQETIDRGQKCYGDDRGILGRVFNTEQRMPTEAELTACTQQVQEKRSQLVELNKDIQRTEATINQARGNYQAAVDAAKKTAGDRATVDAAVKESFDIMKFSIYDQKLLAADAALTLNKMANGIDNSAMGIYLKDRMAGLLNSDTMCSAVKQCPKPRNVKGSDLNSIFNSKISGSASSAAPATAPTGTPAAAKK